MQSKYIRPNPLNVATLTLQGTSTTLQPEGYVRNFPTDKSKGHDENRCETESFLAVCLDDPTKENLPGDINYAAMLADCPELSTVTESTDVTNPPGNINFPLPTKLIEGPDPRATEVFTKIAKATTSILGSILKDKNIFNLQGHSRGAVECCLVAHEISRIKKNMVSLADNASPEQVLAILSGYPITEKHRISEPEKKVRKELKRILAPLLEHPDGLNKLKRAFQQREENYHRDTKEIWVNLCLIDPVPGNPVLGMDTFGAVIGWYDPRMFVYADSVKNVRLLLCENEDSALFDCISPTVAEDRKVDRANIDPTNKQHTYVVALRSPGMHGTPTGNHFGNNGESLISLGVDPSLSAHHVQILTIYSHIDFLEENGSSFIPNLTIPLPLQEYYNYYILNKEQRPSLKCKIYDEIRANLPAYKALNRTTYSSHEVFKDAGVQRENTKNSRPVLTSVDLSKTVLDFVLPFKSEIFINEEHLELYLQTTLGINPNFQPHVQLKQILSAASNQDFCRSLNNEGGLTLDIAKETIKNLVTSVVQNYLQNNIQAATKLELLAAINLALALDIVDDDLHYVPASTGAAEEEKASERELTNLGELKLHLKNNLERYLEDQIQSQVSSHYTSFDLLQDSTSEGNQGVDSKVISALHLHYDMLNFANHLQELGTALHEHQDLSHNILLNVRRLKERASSVIEFCATWVSTHDITEQSILANMAEEEQTAQVKDFLLKVYNYRLAISGHAVADREKFTQKIAELKNSSSRLNQTLLQKKQQLAARSSANNIAGFNSFGLNLLAVIAGTLSIVVFAIALAAIALNASGALLPTICAASGVGLLGISMFSRQRATKISAYEDAVQQLSAIDTTAQLV